MISDEREWHRSAKLQDGSVLYLTDWLVRSLNNSAEWVNFSFLRAKLISWNSCRLRFEFLVVRKRCKLANVFQSTFEALGDNLWLTLLVSTHLHCRVHRVDLTVCLVTVLGSRLDVLLMQHGCCEDGAGPPTMFLWILRVIRVSANVISFPHGQQIRFEKWVSELVVLVVIIRLIHCTLIWMHHDVTGAAHAYGIEHMLDIVLKVASWLIRLSQLFLRVEGFTDLAINLTVTLRWTLEIGRLHLPSILL